MKYFIAFMTLVFTSCGTSQRLFIDRGDSSEVTVGKEEVFAGIRSLVAEQKKDGRKVFNMTLDCSQQFANKSAELTKVVWSPDNSEYVTWIGVTDTLYSLKYFSTTISQSRVKSPLNFVKLGAEDLSLITKLRAKGSDGCLDASWNSEAIIGYLEVNKSK